MELQPYLQWAKTKEKQLPTTRDRLHHAYIGLIGELGEFADWIKRHEIAEQEFNVLEAKKELGDFCFYSAILLNLAPWVENEVPDYPFLSDPTVPVWIDVLDEGVYCVQQAGEAIFIKGAHYVESAQTAGIVLFSWVKGACHLYGWTLSEILDLNVEKLDKRHPNGFTVEGAKLKLDTTGE